MLLGGCDPQTQITDEEQSLALRSGDCNGPVATATLRDNATPPNDTSLELNCEDYIEVPADHEVVSVVFTTAGQGVVLAGRGTEPPAVIAPGLVGDKQTVDLATDYKVGACRDDSCSCEAAGQLACPLGAPFSLGTSITHLIAYPTS
ncbi:MAG: hypothetical protein K0V04_03320 [Deltaproteobacteria bacterium]|nr:hypothetical protein [Deltaproteobacteria bacterium]